VRTVCSDQPRIPGVHEHGGPNGPRRMGLRYGVAVPGAGILARAPAGGKVTRAVRQAAQFLAAIGRIRTHSCGNGASNGQSTRWQRGRIVRSKWN
jgi:hypothetical protein